MTQPELTAAPLQDHALLCLAADWQSKGHQLALAIVISTWGSSPRQVGSVMLVRQDMQIAGSVSGVAARERSIAMSSSKATSTKRSSAT